MEGIRILTYPIRVKGSERSDVHPSALWGSLWGSSMCIMQIRVDVR